jgi:hypothetical protein
MRFWLSRDDLSKYIERNLLDAIKNANLNHEGFYRRCKFFFKMNALFMAFQSVPSLEVPTTSKAPV